MKYLLFLSLAISAVLFAAITLMYASRLHYYFSLKRGVFWNPFRAIDSNVVYISKGNETQIFCCLVFLFFLLSVISYIYLLNSTYGGKSVGTDENDVSNIENTDMDMRAKEDTSP
jgi:hypothetical protein